MSGPFREEAARLCGSAANMADPPHVPPPDTSRSRGKATRRIAFAVLLVLAVYGAVAYLLMPALWLRYAHRHPALDDAPGVTETRDHHPGDPLNVALVGSQEDLERIMKAAEWHRADPLGVKSDLKIAAATVLDRSYDEAPVSALYLWGRKEDLAFEQPVGNSPKQRHHVRFWKAARTDDQGRPLWVGSVTYDERVGFSHTTGQITHHIDGDIDAERDRLFAQLQATGELSQVETIHGFHKVLSGRNGGGDTWHTDGNLLLGTILVQPVE